MTVESLSDSNEEQRVTVDLLITIAYFSIPLQIVWGLVRYPRLTRQVASNRVIVLLILFALFIFCCGFGHLLRFLGWSYTPLFRVVNVVTAAVSLCTALYLVPIMPVLLESVDVSLEKLHRSRRIIHSLYPAHVRDRAVDEMPTSEDDRHSVVSATSHSLLSLSRVRDFRPGSKRPLPLSGYRSPQPSMAFDKTGESSAPLNNGSAPIANKVPSATLLFADLVGFTSWCNEKAPEDVFTFLERLYWEFDSLADQLGVFKLGTIGDCYIAATGLEHNEEQMLLQNHAELMAEFAEKCRQKAMSICREEPGLSGMRFGLHSGEVVTGVLRGQKSRFEIFGDSMNTASRMESLGETNRIHCSKATADLLPKEWCVPRKEKVMAKGKGEMQTFWVQAVVHDDNDDDDDDEPQQPWKAVETV